jgi:alkanesulfonate monooxygenase SsuD/methylene tetrahydromethanopterin reductase-like flavin-dependent oxidoreductase (luciferase family)
VKRKFEVLRDHCKVVGRDYNSILKTKLGCVAIDRDRLALEKRMAVRFKNVPEQTRKEIASFVGTPDEIRSQVESFRNAGIEYLICNFEFDRELQGVEEFADEVLRKF